MDFSSQNNYLVHAKALINQLRLAVDANVGLEVSHKSQHSAETLLIKLMNHAITAMHLFDHGTEYAFAPTMNYSFIDHASIDVLCRAAYENFLIFNYLFILPETSDEREFRYLCWEFSGLFWRSNLELSDPEKQKQVEADNLSSDMLMRQIEAHACFDVLESKKKKKIRKGFSPETWKAIGLQSGFSNVIADTWYSHLCKSAHSGSPSLWQVRKADTVEDQRRLANTSMMFLCIILSFMLHAYCELFPRAKKAIQDDQELSEIIEIYIYVGKNMHM